MDNINYIGLDMSLTGTGFCIKNGQSIEVKTIKTKPADFANDLDRLDFLIKEVRKSIPDNNSFIVLEDVYTPRGNQVGSAMKLIGLAFLIRKCLYEAKFPFLIPTANQIKKYTSGSGATSKDQMTKEVYKRWGVDTKDDNQADAVAMAHLAEALDNYIKTGTMDNNTTKPQAEVIKTITFERPSYNVLIKKKAAIEEE